LLEKLATLEQCGQIKAALESPAGCERVGNYDSDYTVLKVELLSDKSIPTSKPSLILTGGGGVKTRWGGGVKKGQNTT
jgi:hypothetical protein